MKIGWDLGNSLESTENKIGWDNPKTTRQIIDLIIRKGFECIRIPIRWDLYYENKTNYEINSTLMDMETSC